MKYAMMTGMAAALFALGAMAADAPLPKLNVKVDGIGADGFIAPEYAYCVPAAQGHVTDGPDKNPGISWSRGPAGTKSFAVIVVDRDVPTVFTDAGQEGKTLPADMKRQDFYHWVAFDISPHTLRIPAGADSSSLMPHGKSSFKASYGKRGVNDYAGYMASNPDRKGVYSGYDGPCPPWNDERVHHYFFRVFALDVPTLGLSGPVTGAQAMDAIGKHTLAAGGVIGKYTLNPQAKQ